MLEEQEGENNNKAFPGNTSTGAYLFVQHPKHQGANFVKAQGAKCSQLHLLLFLLFILNTHSTNCTLLVKISLLVTGNITL